MAVKFWFFPENLIRSLGHSPLYSEAEADQRKLWRFQPLNLDLLQCTAYLDWDIKVIDLLKRNDVNYDHYQGPSGLVNHPVHLACALESPRSLSVLLDFFGDVREGEVTVTYCNRKACLLPSGQSLKGNTLELAGQHLKSLVVLHQFYLRRANLNPQRVSTSSIQQIWNVLERLCKKVNTWNVYGEVLTLLQGAGGDAVTMFQHVCALPSLDQGETAQSWIDFLKLDILTFGSSVVLTVLSFMTRVQLQRLAKAFDPCIHCSSSHSPENRSLLSKKCARILELHDLVQAELQGRTLRQECVLAVLQSVGGNCLRTVDIPMAGGLMFLFQVPFWTEWQALTSVLE